MNAKIMRSKRGTRYDNHIPGLILSVRSIVHPTHLFPQCGTQIILANSNQRPKKRTKKCILRHGSSTVVLLHCKDASLSTVRSRNPSTRRHNTTTNCTWNRPVSTFTRSSSRNKSIAKSVGGVDRRTRAARNRQKRSIPNRLPLPPTPTQNHIHSPDHPFVGYTSFLPTLTSDLKKLKVSRNDHRCSLIRPKTAESFRSPRPKTPGHR